jgi:asparagine synthetase B (glutamine-hydrolysing)
MFLYIRDATAMNFAPGRGLEFIKSTIRTVAHNNERLLWTEDSFTEFEERPGQIEIGIRRPEIDREPLVRVVWKHSLDEMVVERRWSGEFSAYIALKPTCVIASHLRFIAWLFRGLPAGTRQLQPGWRIKLAQGRFTEEGPELQRARRKNSFDHDATIAGIRRWVTKSVRRVPIGSALLLSGGVDSSVIAAVGQQERREMRPYVFGLKHLVQPQKEVEGDFAFAQTMCTFLSCPLAKIRLEQNLLVRNAAQAVALAETSRGTIIDDCVALMEVAQRLRRRGFSTVVMGEAADDLFGGFKFALRYYRGRQLQEYFVRELNVSLPNELCIIQKIFEPWGISVVHPYWTLELKEVAESLPLNVRVDSKRLMKRILRDAFGDILPMEIKERPKGVTRDTTQIRLVLEERFGKSRERYRGLFNRIFRDGFRWPQKRKN